ncbi:MAG: class I SAM-dependent methyltransferase [Thaumarchaeota archaeon]|nr:class I SAM-dependent methyltransferase [Nitrososphaerota archaeon]MBI3022604.1 class I SAM-dependent methyltransferase [Nitrososphaerota archaeon]
MQSDKQKAEAFSEQLLGILNHSMLALMISIGHKTNLFDVMARLPHSTSKEIAEKTGLNERYVTEWLKAMVVGRILEYDPNKSTHKLPKEHAAYLTKSAGADNLSVFMQYVSLLGKVEEQIINSFREGGGVPYSAYPEFQRLQAEETARIFDSMLVDKIIPLVPGLVERMRKGISALDIGCGRGRAVNLMAKAFPNSEVLGYDISKEAIAVARREAKAVGLSNAHFEIKDAAKLAELGKYDLITAFDAIHDQAQPTKVLKAICRALKPTGTFLMQDIAGSSNVHENMQNPLAPTLYTFSTMHCMTVSLAYKGEGWGTLWGEQMARQKLQEAGFKRIEVKKIEGDIVNNYFVATKT